jgi:hypothetical protein
VAINNTHSGGPGTAPPPTDEDSPIALDAEYLPLRRGDPALESAFVVPQEAPPPRAPGQGSLYPPRPDPGPPMPRPGTFGFSAGGVWSGPHLHGLRHGVGTCQYRNGAVVQGMWDKGVVRSVGVEIAQLHQPAKLTEGVKAGVGEDGEGEEDSDSGDDGPPCPSPTTSRTTFPDGYSYVGTTTERSTPPVSVQPHVNECPEGQKHPVPSTSPTSLTIAPVAWYSYLMLDPMCRWASEWTTAWQGCPHTPLWGMLLGWLAQWVEAWSRNGDLQAGSCRCVCACVWCVWCACIVVCGGVCGVCGVVVCGVRCAVVGGRFVTVCRH